MLTPDISSWLSVLLNALFCPFLWSQIINGSCPKTKKMGGGERDEHKSLSQLHKGQTQLGQSMLSETVAHNFLKMYKVLIVALQKEMLSTLFQPAGISVWGDPVLGCRSGSHVILAPSSMPGQLGGGWGEGDEGPHIQRGTQIYTICLAFDTLHNLF